MDQRAIAAQYDHQISYMLKLAGLNPLDRCWEFLERMVTDRFRDKVVFWVLLDQAREGLNRLWRIGLHDHTNGLNLLLSTLFVSDTIGLTLARISLEGEG